MPPSSENTRWNAGRPRTVSTPSTRMRAVPAGKRANDAWYVSSSPTRNGSSRGVTCADAPDPSASNRPIEMNCFMSLSIGHYRSRIDIRDERRSPVTLGQGGASRECTSPSHRKAGRWHRAAADCLSPMRPGPSAKRLSTLTTLRAVVGVIALALVAACGGRAEGASLDSAAGSDGSPPSARARILTDENILAVTGEGARAGMHLARLAPNRVKHARVKRFAQALGEDHSRTDRAVKDLERKLNLTEELPASDTTAQELQHLVERFNSLKPSAFDTAFINHVIENHARDIAEARMLAGRAKRPEVRELLQSSIPELKAHLNHAKTLKQELRKRR